MLSDLLYRLRALLRRNAVESELDDELRLHVEKEAAKYERSGLTPDEARRRARLALGGVEQVKEDCRDVRGTRWIEDLAQDLRYGIRQLRFNLGFAAVAICSLALGVGANTAIFQLVNAVRLRPLPVERPWELAEIRIAGGNKGMGLNPSRYGGLTRPLWEEIQRDHPAFSEVFAWGTESVGVGRASEVQLSSAIRVSGEFFRTLGVSPWRGRLLQPSDETSCPATVAVVSYSYWQRAVGARELDENTTLIVNGEVTQIVGVTPPSFFGLAVGEPFDLALALCRPPQLRRDVFATVVMGRLRPGWNLDRASSQLQAASPALFEATAPTGYTASTVERFKAFRLEASSAATGVSWLRNEYDASLILLLGITGLVLLIACANLASLMLARASTREREVAVRMALGASRGRLLRQMTAESGLVAFVGAAFGLAIAQPLSRALIQAISTETNTVELSVATDWRVLSFTAMVAAATCLLFGIVPALRGTRAQPVEAMKVGGRGLSQSSGRTTIHRAIVVTQIAVSLVLLVGAVLFVRSLYNLSTFDPGLRLRGITIAFVGYRDLKGPPERLEALQRQLLEAIRSVPGVVDAATTTNIPLLGGSWSHGVKVGAVENSSKFTWVSSGYFRTMGIPVLEGRGFDEHDTGTSRRVAIVNQMFARVFLGGASPIGRVLRTSPEPNFPATEYEIVGVIADTKYNELRGESFPMTFAPAGQYPVLGPWANLMIHSTTAPTVTMDAAKRAISRTFPEAMVNQIVFETRVRDSMVRERVLALLAGFFGMLATVLAMIGLYGLIAYLVARRRNEIGVRLALGARPAQVVGMVARDAGRLLSLGLAIGVVLALIVARSAGSTPLLFGLTPYDPPTLVGACLLLGAIAGFGCLIPARRASKLDALIALRHE
jgi:putative ABC transport system permease protein